MTDKPTYEEMENQLKELKNELDRSRKTRLSSVEINNELDFHDLFDLQEIQKIQDLFAEVIGVASIITDPNGIPITKPSNFSRLCSEIIRKTEKGLKNCYHSNAMIGQQNICGPICQPCVSSGLWHGYARIIVGGKHIANWLIGQVKVEDIEEDKILLFAKEIGADELEFKKALDEVAVMSMEKFKKITDILFFFANDISQKAYQNFMQNHLIDELQQKEVQLTEAKEKAEKNERQNQKLFEILPIGLALTKMTGELVSVNKAFAHIIGYSEAETLNLSYWDITPQKYAEQEQEQLNSLSITGFYGPYEKEYRHKSGELIPVRLIGRIVTINNEDFIWSSIEDISEKKQSEIALLKAKEEIEESERTFRKLFEESADAILLIDRAGVFTECNQAALNLLKIPREQLLRRSPVDISPEYQPDGQKSQEAAVEMMALAYKQTRNRFDWTHVNAEGGAFIVEVSLMPIVIKGQTMLHTTWRDITERKQMEEDLRERMKELQLFYTLSEIAQHEDVTLDMLCQELVDILPKSWKYEKIACAKLVVNTQEYQSDNYRKCAYVQTAPIVVKGEPIGALEVGYLIKPISVDFKPFLQEEQQLLEAVSKHLAQIIARVSAERENRRFRIISDNAVYGKAINDLEGNFIYVNPFFAKIHGYTPEELIGRPISMLHSQTQMETVNTVIDQMFRDGSFAPTTIWHRHKNGDEFPMLMSGVVLKDDAGNTQFLATSSVDISAHYQTEEALRESEEIFSTLMEHSPIHVFFKDENIRALKLSKNFENMLGKPLSELLGKTMDDLFPSELAKKMIADDKRILEEGKVVTVEEEFNGRYYLTTKFPMEIEGKPRYLAGYTMDITERKHSEIELQEKNEEIALQNEELNQTNWELIQAKRKVDEREVQLKYSQKVASIGYFLFDVKADSWTSSEMLDEILGIDESFNRNVEGWLSLIHPDQQQEMFEYLTVNILQNHESFNKSYQIINRKSNCPCWVQGHATLEFDEEGNLSKLFGTIQDVSISKKYEQEILLAKELAEENEAKFRNIIEKSPISIMLANTHGETIYLNNQFVETFGYTIEEVSTVDKWFELAYPDLDYRKAVLQEWTAEVEKAIKNNCPVKGRQLQIVCKNGEAKTVAISAYFEKDISIGLFQDVTERVKAEQELKAAIEVAEMNNANVTAIIEGTANSIWAFNRNYEVLYINKVFQQEFYDTFGVFLEPGVSLIDSLPEPLRPFWKPRYDRVLANEPFVEEDVVETGDGNLYIDVAFNPIVKNGTVIGGSCFGSNITDRKLAELELIKAKEKAEESDRLKSAFLANMSHEIRTPMNGILGFSELLKEPGLTGEEQHEYIEIIEKSGRRMLSIINDIVDISKIEAGLMKLDIKETNMNEQIDYIYDFFKHESDAKQIALSFHKSLPTKKAIIKTDCEKVYAILINLVKNAIKYTPKGAIEFGYHLIMDQTPHKLEFYVKDTGIGIPKERQEAIFERFIQAEIIDTMARQGAGLGLSISKAYVEMLGGEIWLESEVGKGTTFYFTLPYNAEPSIEPFEWQPTPSRENERVEKLKILIAEDDEVSEMLIDRCIKNYSKEILKARTGVEAVEICRNHPDIDLILMDVQMPIMGGYEATRHIREFNKEVVIIAQTAFALSGDREKSIASGCNDYLPKPINKEDLEAMILQYFGR